jgi:hypothetical protein
MPNGLSVAQLAQLNGMNPFGVNMNMLNMMGITAEAQLLTAQIAATGGSFRQPGLNVNAGLETFAGLQGGMGAGQRSGPGRSGGHSPGAGSSKGTMGNGAKKDEDDFDPV